MTILSGQLAHVSPSSIQNFLGCNRRWWHEYSQGVERVTHPAAALGTALHGELERYLLDSKDPTSERLLPALEYFPPAGAGIEIESLNKETGTSGVLVETWLLKDLGFVKFKGRADVIDLRGVAPKIQDLKTTGNIRYAKTGPQLKANVQMLCYAHVLMESLDAPSVEVEHVYCTTKGAHHSHTASAYIDRDEAAAFWDRMIVPTAREMVIAYQEEWRSSVEPTRSECSAFGGCPHKALCPDVHQKSLNI